jgi:hypothetical protein
VQGVFKVTSSLLPPWLPDWEGAEEISRRVDEAALRGHVAALLDLVFTDDAVFLDSLPGDLESALVSPLNILGEIHEHGANLTELVVASRLVRRSTVSYLHQGPEKLRDLIESLPE